MLTVQEAQQTILDACSPMQERENVSLANALHRILSKNYIATVDVPPESNSAMDGYALCSNDLVSDSTVLEISQRIPAGSSPKALKPGTAARIFTGGIIPAGADAVAMQEDCEQSNDGTSVVVKKKVVANENIRPRGQDLQKGSLLFEAGHKLRPQDLGVLASLGFAQLNVYKQPVIALIGTGDELVEPGIPLKSGQIYNSNKFMLSAMLKQLGCNILVTNKAVKDDLASTIAALENAAQHADLVITTGGVSVGEEDYIKPAIQQLGEIQNWKIKLKPGKPLVFGKVLNTPLIGLPGNPVSSFVTFLLFAAPFIRKLKGSKTWMPSADTLPINFSIDKKRQRPEYMRVQIREKNGSKQVERYSNQSSGVLASTIWADALALIPEERELRVGDPVNIFPLNTLMA